MSNKKERQKDMSFTIKMRKGFTLIELLAVIVILAIISLIATPIVLSLISDAKESAMLRSAEFYLDGVENSIMEENLAQNGNFKPTECTITNEGNLQCDDKEGILNVEVDGETPIAGKITFEEGKIKKVNLIYKTETIVKDSEGNLTYNTYTSLGNYQHQSTDGVIEDHDVQNGECSKCKRKVLEPGLYREDGTFVSWEQLTDINYKKITWTEYEMMYDEEIPYESPYEVSSPILRVINGKVTCARDEYTDQNLSSRYLNGKLILPNDSSITGIETYGFIRCSKLTSIEIPNNITFIGTRAFMDCPKLKEVIITDSITTLGYLVFESTEWLTQKKKENPLVTIGNILYDGRSYKETKLVIPSNIEVINRNAFDGNKTIEKVEIHNGVTAIGAYAFRNCSKLSQVYFRQTTVPKLDKECFYKSSGDVITFNFKNNIVFDSLIANTHYNSAYGTKSNNYDW